jgi:hypothetical protein
MRTVAMILAPLLSPSIVKIVTSTSVPIGERGREWGSA